MTNRKGLNLSKCDYCSADIRRSTESYCPPSHADDKAWAALANVHNADCYWVHSRAHTGETMIGDDYCESLSMEELGLTAESTPQEVRAIAIALSEEAMGARIFVNVDEIVETLTEWVEIAQEMAE